MLWTFAAPGVHSVTESSGMGLFDSSFPPPVSYFAYRFVAAGTYAYVDRGVGATGTVTVPVTARPSAAPGYSPVVAIVVA